MKFGLILIIFSIHVMSTLGQSFSDIIKIEEKLNFDRGNFKPNIELSWVYTIDESSNIIDTNLKGHNVTIYNSSGKLINRFGSRGQGPGDFEYPTSSIRVEDGRILVSEFSGKMSLFSSDGDSLIEIFDTKVLPLTSIIEIGKNKILLAGNSVEKRDSSYLLHIYDISNQKVDKSFLKLPFDHRDYAQVFRMSAQLVVATNFGNKIAAAVTPFKKIYFFSTNGDLEKSFQLGLNKFTEPEKTTNSFTSDQIFEYTSTFSMIERLFFLPKEELFLISYSRVTEVDVKNPSDRIMEYSLACFDKEGRILFELNDTPELLTVDLKNSYLFFRGHAQDPSHLLKGKINRSILTNNR